MRHGAAAIQALYDQASGKEMQKDYFQDATLISGENFAKFKDTLGCKS